MMKVDLKEKAKELNVPLEVVARVLEELLREEKLRGVIDHENHVLIRYSQEELENLIRLLETKQISIKELSSELNLSPEQLRLVIYELLKTGRVKGLFTRDGEFISYSVMEDKIIKLTDEAKELNVHDLSAKLSVPEEKVREIIEKIAEKVINTLKPYRQINIIDLCRQTKLPENFTIAILRELILSGKIIGSLDMVNNVFVKEHIATVTTKGKPPSYWYLVPILLGVLGGIAGYFAVKDEDKTMANNLIALGIVSTILSLLLLYLLLL